MPAAKTPSNPKKKSPDFKECSLDQSSLDELPDTVYVPLGRRGMESVALKVCPDCSHENLALIQKIVQQDVLNEDGPPARKELIDYRVRCCECAHPFTIRLTRLYFKEKLIQTLVSILAQNGESELWLGNLF
jgi:hypothetical protein